MMRENGHTTCPSANMSTPFPTWLALGLNTGLRRPMVCDQKTLECVSTTAYLNA
jgi:hypothetical protein